MDRILNLIDGASVPAASGMWLDVHDPARGEVHAHLSLIHI